MKLLVTGGFGFIGIMAIGPFLASQYISIKDSGFLVAGQSLFRIIEGIAGAFGIVALPKIAKLIKGRGHDFLKGKLQNVAVFIFHIGIFTSLHLFLWSDQIVLFWLGNQFEAAICLFKIFSLVVTPYLVFTMLYSAIDAVQKRAINTLNIYISFLP